MKSTKYDVIFEPFTERYFIKTFARKYKGAWDFTRKTITEEFEKIDFLFQKNIAEYITDKNVKVIICKTEFKISGTQESRHGSGNRCIVAIHKDINKVCVLLVYHKNDLRGDNETVEWKSIIRNNYSEYKNFL
jgi:hypothetical protein